MTGRSDYTTDEMMTVAAARALVSAPQGNNPHGNNPHRNNPHRNNTVFVGIGLPSTAANLARNLHAPDLVLVYESGCIGSKPPRIPLSVGDGFLATTADEVVGVAEMFNYWVQPGRFAVAFLGAAQIDRFANINTTVVGAYDSPAVRLPGAGGAPEIASGCGEVFVIVRQTPRAFVGQVDFVTSVGHGSGPGDRARLGLRGRGPTRVITDLGVLEPDPQTCELVMTSLHPGATEAAAKAATGWDLRFAPGLAVGAPPTDRELEVLRELKSRG